MQDGRQQSPKAEQNRERKQRTTCLVSTAEPSMDKPTAGQTVLPSTDSQGAKKQNCLRVRAEAPSKHIQTKQDAWPFARHLRDAGGLHCSG